MRDVIVGGLSQAASASGPVLAFVASADDAPPSRPGSLTIVLDTAWTPAPGAPPEVVSARAGFADVLERHDLYQESLDLLDHWAEATGLADLLIVDGVTYWFRVRESMWRWVHERLLWRYVLAGLDAVAPVGPIAVPASEEALIDVVRALGRSVEVDGGPGDAMAALPVRPGRSAGATLRAGLRRVVRTVIPAPATVARREHERFLDARFERLTSTHGARVLVLTLPGSYQRIGDSVDGARRDPNLGAVITALEVDGLEPIVIGMDMGRRGHEDWSAVEVDERLLPLWYVHSRWGRPEDDARAAAAAVSAVERLATAPTVPLDLGGVDLAPAARTTILDLVGRIIEAEVRSGVRIERMLQEVRPRAVLTSQEAHRTAWLKAGAQAGIPTFALQHGVLYATHPGYPSHRHPALVLPTCTFVFGDYERRVLLAGAYLPAQVSVSGSPRLDLDAGHGSAQAAAECSATRRELGVADDDRLLVVSTLHLPFVRRSHLVHMLEVCLGGPLPGVHVVFKQHPGERDAGPCRELLVGLARAGGYDPPPITVVKDIDLYRLLRAADAHLGLKSTVLTDALVAGTDDLIALVEPEIDLLGYVEAGVARPIRGIVDLQAALDDRRPPDPAAVRAFLADHFEPGDASARIAAAIRSAIDDTTSGSVR